MSKSRKIYLYGGTTFGGLLIFLMTLTMYGVNIEINKDFNLTCASGELEPCIDYFNITLEVWHLCTGKDFEVYMNDTDANLTLYRADRRFRADNPLRWKPYDLSEGCLKNATRHEFKVVVNKSAGKTVKYGVRAGLTDHDPIFAGYKESDFYMKMINLTSEIDRGEVNYEWKNPTSANRKINATVLGAEYLYFPGSRNVTSRTVEFNTTVKQNISSWAKRNATREFEIINRTGIRQNRTVEEDYLRTEEIEYEGWTTEKTVKPGETIKVRERLSWPAGFKQKFDWQPYVYMFNTKFRNQRWAFFSTDYDAGTNLTANETSGKAWTNLVYQWEMVNLSGAMTNMTDVVFVNESCDNGGSQIRGSINGTGDGYSGSPGAGTLYFNFSIPLNMTANQDRIICAYHLNLTGVAPPARVQTQHSNANSSAAVNRSWVFEGFSGSVCGVANGAFNLTARGNETWFKESSGHCRAFVPTINFSRGFTSNFEISRREGGTGSGHFTGCGFWFHGSDAGFDISSNMGGVMSFDDLGDTGLRATQRRGVFNATLVGATPETFNNESSKCESAGAGCKYNA